VFVAIRSRKWCPRYLLALRGVIDSPDIPLNGAAAPLQTDPAVFRLDSVGFVARKVAIALKACCIATKAPDA